MKYPRLKIAFIEKGVPQVKIARKLGRDPAWLSRVIHGWVEPSEAERRMLSRILAVPSEELFKDLDHT